MQAKTSDASSPAQPGRDPRGSRWILRRWPEALAALGGLAWFVALAGPGPLVPTNLDWLGTGDRAAQLSAWLLFRNEPWSLPLGNLTGLHHPVGTTIAIADGIPLVALLARLLSPVLPVDFQYVGPWLALCFALQGWYGARLAGVVASGSPGVRVAGGLLFAMAPLLMVRAVDPRMLHPSLCAQWLVLRGLALALTDCPDPGTGRSLLRRTIGGVAIASLVHPVIAVHAIVIGVGLLARLALLRMVSPGALVAWAGALLAVPAGLFASTGYLGGPPVAGKGFGEWSADLLFLVNPFGWSRFLPTLPATFGQYEGFGYPGLGWLVVGLAALASLLLARPRLDFAAAATWGPLLALAVLLGAFSLSSQVTAGGRLLARLDWLYDGLSPITSAFRSSGRFIWLLVYLACAAAIARVGAVRSSRPRLVAALLCAAVVIQAADLWSPRTREAFAEERWTGLDPAWTFARGQYRHLVLAPPEIPATGPACFGAYDWDYYVPLAYVAYRTGMTFNSGFVTRVDAARLTAYCEGVVAGVMDGRLADDAVYVLHPALRARAVSRGALCGCIADYTVCVGRARRTPLVEVLERSQGRSCVP